MSGTTISENTTALNYSNLKGDSGGPLTVEASGQHRLIGIVSFGNGCGKVRGQTYTNAELV